MSKIRQMERSEAQFGELDKIVGRLFDDLAIKADAPKTARAANTDVGRARPPQRDDMRSSQSAAERLRRETPSPIVARFKSSPTEIAPGEPERSLEDAEALECDNVSLENDDVFVERTISHLAFHPNATLLFERIRSGLKQEIAPDETAAEEIDGKEQDFAVPVVSATSQAREKL
jgi:hypothetical protein